MTKAHNLRWLWSALAIVAGVGAGYVFVQHTEWVDERVNLPASGRALSEPHYVLEQWLVQLGAKLVLTERLDRLPPIGATLVLSSPFWDFNGERVAEIRHWVGQGGHLVLLASVPEGQAWLPWLHVERSEVWKLKRAARRARQQAHPASAPPDEDEEDGEDTEDKEAPAAAASEPVDSAPAARREAVFPARAAAERCNWLVQESGRAAPYFPAVPRWQLCDDPGAVFQSRDAPVWGLRDDWGWRVLRLTQGRGQVTVSSWYTLHSDRELLRHDRPLLAAAVLDLKPGREIWLAESERWPVLPVWLWQQAAPACGLILLALAAWIAAHLPRFGPLRRSALRGRRSLGAQVQGTAAFLRHHRSAALRQAQVRALLEAARRCLGAAEAEADSVWTGIAAATGLPEARLREAAQRAAASTPQAYFQDLQILEMARRRLQDLAPGHVARRRPPFSNPLAP